MLLLIRIIQCKRRDEVNLNPTPNSFLISSHVCIVTRSLLSRLLLPIIRREREAYTRIGDKSYCHRFYICIPNSNAPCGRICESGLEKAVWTTLRGIDEKCV